MSYRYRSVLVLLSAGFSAICSWMAAEQPRPSDSYPIVRVAVSSSGYWFAAASASGWIGIFDREHPDTPQRFRAGEGALKDLRFTADEKWLVVENAAIVRHPVDALGVSETVPPGEDRGQPQQRAPAPQGIPAGEITSNVVPGPEPGTVLLGNFAGSLEIRTPEGALRARYTFR